MKIAHNTVFHHDIYPSTLNLPMQEKAILHQVQREKGREERREEGKQRREEKRR
jgi:hypothetical protein